MSEDNQWRQLGSIVNGVLLETQTKAMRQGLISRPAPVPLLAAAVQPAGPHRAGFLPQAAPAAAQSIQLELPFGIGAAPQETFGKPGAPRRARLL